MSDSPRMAYAGVRLSNKDTLIQQWQPVSPTNEPVGEAEWYKSKLVPHSGIGSVWIVQRSDTGILVKGDKAPVRSGEWVDEAIRIDWEARDADAKEEHERLQLAKDEAKISLIREQMLPLRIAMVRHRRMSNSALVSAINRELWRPLTKEETKAAGL